MMALHKKTLKFTETVNAPNLMRKKNVCDYDNSLPIHVEDVEIFHVIHGNIDL